MNPEVVLMNKIVMTCIEHGGDAGGAYCCQSQEVKDILSLWLKVKELDKEYKVTGHDYPFIVPIDFIDGLDEDSLYDKVAKSHPYPEAEVDIMF